MLQYGCRALDGFVHADEDEKSAHWLLRAARAQGGELLFEEVRWVFPKDWLENCIGGTYARIVARETIQAAYSVELAARCC